MIAYKKNDDTLIDEDLLDKNEARDFILFLIEERHRHLLALRLCDEKRYIYESIPVLAEAYKSSVVRHLKDITMIDETIRKLILKHNLNFNDFYGQM